MSFYITIKEAKLSPQHQNPHQNVSILITSRNNRLLSTFNPAVENPKWQDAFVAEGSERQLQFMLIKQKQPKKSATKLSANNINLSKYLVLNKDQTDQISLYINEGNKQSDKLTIEVCYRENKNFIGPIEFYKKGGEDFEQDEPFNLDIEGDSSRFPFWKRWFSKDNEKTTEDNSNAFQFLHKDNVKFYKGPHKNRNIFSLCDEVYDDQKFTVVQNYYNDE